MRKRQDLDHGFYIKWLPNAHFTMRTYKVNQEFRFDEGICLSKEWSNLIFFREIPFFTSYVRNVK